MLLATTVMKPILAMRFDKMMTILILVLRKDYFQVQKREKPTLSINTVFNLTEESSSHKLVDPTSVSPT